MALLGESYPWVLHVLGVIRGVVFKMADPVLSPDSKSYYHVVRWHRMRAARTSSVPLGSPLIKSFGSNGHLLLSMKAKVKAHTTGRGKLW